MTVGSCLMGHLELLRLAERRPLAGDTFLAFSIEPTAVERLLCPFPATMGGAGEHDNRVCGSDAMHNTEPT